MRVMNQAKSAFDSITSHVAIDIDTRKGSSAGRSAGLGLVLTAETTNGILVSGESCMIPGEKNPNLAGEIAQKATDKLFQEIFRGCSVDESTQSMLLIHMALSTRSVSKVLLPYPSDYM
ncbi:RNA 3'-terminal phosphate cyclase-like protein [Thelohanellus kitauei]|uniref:RNA 3'-terminal phosphate cyclase-like protein n=1 Tax=Thelohanellus kitauei TaxID=669202 RepID=A0A0C2N6J3_THEKT|nr:RNA 3'-terminal phosphate cyclase-like protein [Thelohanellus kitauei]